MNIILGGAGFVGSAFVRHLTALGAPVLSVTRQTYEQHRGTRADVLVIASGNSRKYLADENPVEDFERSVAHVMRAVHDFPARRVVLLSSCEVYGSRLGVAPCEELTEGKGLTNYGFHKRLAEQAIEHHCRGNHLIMRLAGMVGPGLKKGPVYDILTGAPLRLDSRSRLPFLHTEDAARAMGTLLYLGETGVFNIAGEGTVSLDTIARMAGVETRQEPGSDNWPIFAYVDVNKATDALVKLPQTQDVAREFVAYWQKGGR